MAAGHTMCTYVTNNIGAVLKVLDKPNRPLKDLFIFDVQ